MVEKKYNYTAKFRQPQTVVGIKLNPKGGSLTERNLKDLRKDAYGASLLDNGLLVVVEATADAAPAEPEKEGEIIPDFDET
jgi:hypothetical protein